MYTYGSPVKIQNPKPKTPGTLSAAARNSSRQCHRPALFSHHLLHIVLSFSQKKKFGVHLKNVIIPLSYSF